MNFFYFLEREDGSLRISCILIFVINFCLRRRLKFWVEEISINSAIGHGQGRHILGVRNWQASARDYSRWPVLVEAMVGLRWYYPLLLFSTSEDRKHLILSFSLFYFKMHCLQWKFWRHLKIINISTKISSLPHLKLSFLSNNMAFSRYKIKESYFFIKKGKLDNGIVFFPRFFPVGFIFGKEGKGKKLLSFYPKRTVSKQYTSGDVCSSKSVLLSPTHILKVMFALELGKSCTHWEAHIGRGKKKKKVRSKRFWVLIF